MNHSTIRCAGCIAAAMLAIASGCAGNRHRLASNHAEQPAFVKASPQPLVQTVAYNSGSDEAEASDADKSAGTEASSGLAIVPVEVVPIQPPVFASATPVAYSLADIEQFALANNPAIAAANAGSNVASGLRQQVGVRPNPTIGYWGSQLADQKTEQNGAFIDQEFVRGNKLALNREVLRHTVDAQRWEAETQRYRVLTDVRMRFYEALAAQRQLEATGTFSKVAARGVEVAEIRYEAEEGTLIEVLQSKTLMSETNLAIEQTEAAYLGAWKDLAAVAGVPDLQPAKLNADFDLPAETPDWDLVYSTIASESPELATANALVCEKQANLRRQQAQPIPNLNVQFQTGYDRSTDSGLINLQIGAPIPINNKNTGNISAAFAEYKRALENKRRIELGIRSRLARATQEYQAAFAAVTKYNDQIVPQAKQTLDLSEEGYRAGELDFLQVLVVRRVYYESTIRLIIAQGQLAQATAKVDGLLLVGGLDAPQDYTTGDGLRGQTLSGQ